MVNVERQVNAFPFRALNGGKKAGIALGTLEFESISKGWTTVLSS